MKGIFHAAYPLAGLSARLPSRRQCGVCSVALAGQLDASAAPLAAGHTFSVTSNADLPDVDQTLVECKASKGLCTLRAAVMQANYTTGTDTITLPSNLYLLSRQGDDDNAVAGDLDISEDVTIRGASSAATIIDGNSAATRDRVFHILPSAANVSLIGLTIRHGQAPTATASGLVGGGIYRDSTTSLFSTLLSLNDVLVESNTAETGGGIYGVKSTVMLTNTGLDASSSTLNGGGMLCSGCGLTIRDSLVYSNTAYQGAGLALKDTYWGRIERTTIYSNTATAYGGGIFNGMTTASLSTIVALYDSTVRNNSAASNGGAIDNYAPLVISRTVVDSNRAGQYGGAIMVYDTNYPSAMSIEESTLSHNAAQFGGTIYYNDFCCTGSAMTLLNSTLSNNSATHDGGGIHAIGDAHIWLFNTTIAGNTLNRPVGGMYPAAVAASLSPRPPQSARRIRSLATTGAWPVLRSSQTIAMVR